MATTTTNYGFDVPQSSDLVKNGATQIALLGQDLDTFLFRPFSKNTVINGGMDVWARGTTGFATTAGTYTADRWRLGSNNTTVTRDTDVPVSPYFKYSLKMVGTAANSIIQRVESANSTLLAGQTVTFSFYAKRTAGTGNLDVRFYYPTAVDNFASTTQIGSTQVVSATPSASWTRYSVTVAIGTNITNGLEILINNDAGSGSTTFITGCQLEIGSQVSPFTRSGTTIGGEISLCQRYYETNYQAGYKAGDDIAALTGTEFSLVALNATGSTRGSSRARAAGMAFVVPKRATPTMRVWDRVGNLTKYTAGDADLSSISNNNSFDLYGGIAGYSNTVTFQTVFASATHYGAFVQWEASAEL
jgi:hypothetical protein